MFAHTQPFRFCSFAAGGPGAASTQTASHRQPGMHGHPAPLGGSWHTSGCRVFSGASRGSGLQRAPGGGQQRAAGPGPPPGPARGISNRTLELPTTTCRHALSVFFLYAEMRFTESLAIFKIKGSLNHYLFSFTLSGYILARKYIFFHSKSTF